MIIACDKPYVAAYGNGRKIPLLMWQEDSRGGVVGIVLHPVAGQPVRADTVYVESGDEVHGFVRYVAA